MSVCEFWRIQALIYSNSPATDQSLAILNILNNCQEHEKYHIYTVNLKDDDKVWIVSDERISTQKIADIVASDWADQAQVISMDDEIDDLGVNFYKQAGYAQTVAQELNDHLQHRPEVLNGMMAAISGDVGWGSEDWSVHSFMNALRQVTEIESVPKFAKFINDQKVFLRQIIGTALLTNLTSDQTPRTTASAPSE